jgi:hypothetical protein
MPDFHAALADQQMLDPEGCRAHKRRESTGGEPCSNLSEAPTVNFAKMGKFPGSPPVDLGVLAAWCGLRRCARTADFTVYKPCRKQPLWSIETCAASLAVLKKVSRAGGGRIRCAAAALAEVKGRRYLGEGAMTVAELIEKLLALLGSNGYANSAVRAMLPPL